jgi:hypothetical protein
MKRYMTATIAALAVLAVIPATAVARGHRRHSHHSRVEHFRVRNHLRRHSSDPSGTGTSQDVGTIQSFTGQVLTIKLNDAAGTMVSGTVGPDTQVDCSSATENDSQSEDGGPGASGSGGDDQSGSGDQSGSDGQPGAGNDQGGGGDGQPSAGNDQGGGGDDQGDDNDDQGANNNCMTALQTVGTGVRDATLRFTSAGPVWEEVDLDA